MQYLGYTYPLKIFGIYLKCRFNEVGILHFIWHLHSQPEGLGSCCSHQSAGGTMDPTLRLSLSTLALVSTKIQVFPEGVKQFLRVLSLRCGGVCEPIPSGGLQGRWERREEPRWGEMEQISSCGTFPWLPKKKERQTISLLSLIPPETLLGPPPTWHDALCSTSGDTSPQETQGRYQLSPAGKEPWVFSWVSDVLWW